MSGRWVAPIARGPLQFDQLGPAEVRRGARAVFLDRDGVLNEGRPDPETQLLESPLSVEDVRVLDGTGAALHRLQQAGYALVCVSNQPAAAKGKAPIEDLRSVHERVLELTALEGPRLDTSRLCPHHPDGVVSPWSGACGCRKPAPGMLFDAAIALEIDLSGSWMLGDTDADVRAGEAAGCATVLIEYPGSAHKRSGLAHPTLRATDLPDAAAQLLERPS